MNEFQGIPYEVVTREVWHVGSRRESPLQPPKSVGRSTHWQKAGCPYELEAVIAGDDERAAFVAAVLETRAAAEQLSRPVDPTGLTQRQVRVSSLRSESLRMLWAAGPEVDHWLRQNRIAGGWLTHDARVTLIQSLRAAGWRGPIIVPSPIDDAYTVLVPRRFLTSGAVRVVDTGALTVPGFIVEHALGIRLLPQEFRWNVDRA